jgi:ATP-dependent DNA helicase RecG
MKPSLRKLYNFFKLESERGYDDHAVLGGLRMMLERWEAEARADGLSEDLIQVVAARIRDYSRLSPKSRAESLGGLWRRIGRSEEITPITFRTFEAEIPGPSETTGMVVESSKRRHVASPQTPKVTPETRADPGPQESPTEQDTAPITATEKQPKIKEPAALDAPISVLPGIGPHHSETLARLNINVLRDMLFYFPRRYDDYSKLKTINHLKYGDELTVIATVQSVRTRNLRGRKKQLVEVIVSDGSGALRVNWFNQPWITKRLKEGSSIVLSGKIDQYLGRLIMNNPEWEPLEQQHLNTNRIVPVYPLTAGITQRWLRRSLNQVVTYWAPRVRDPLPQGIRSSGGLLDITTALMQIHFPDTWDDLGRARYRLAFDEIFLLQLGVLRQKRAWQERSGRVFETSVEWINEQTSCLPFSLTDAQQRVFQDIRQDLNSGHPMNRLLQGDVGSGKTVIAALAVSAVTHQDAQAAIMAPTSILAEQHYGNLLNLLTKRGNSHEITPAPLEAEQIKLMLGATPDPEKDEIRTGLAEGKIKLIIGTHALIEEPVNFNDLQLVIVDEQHRFGVKQRAALRSKGSNPHLMVMTATPIPRSLALTVYGDLDISVMDEMPPGRPEVSTYIITPKERERAYSLIRAQIQQNHQAFIIYPLVEESEKSAAKAAVEEHARLQEEVFQEYNIGLLHGRLKQEEKETIMADFRDGKFHILVSTTVVEVGVDIPNATVMLVEGAHRFGLAQLHQLRGRVGRGSDKAYCLLIPENVNAVENERLQVMTETNDGFILAERDLEQRGPGQFLGTRQSGYSELKLANLSDVKLISNARRNAKALFEKDPDLTQPENQLLAEALAQAWSSEKGDIS